MSLQHYQYTNPLSETDKWLQRTVRMGPQEPTTGLQGSVAQSVGNTGLQETCNVQKVRWRHEATVS
jgi:hypothetical protein